MVEYSKVVWSEGVYLSPQHLQQSDRHLEKRLQDIVKFSQAHFYGFYDLEIDKELLSQGLISLSRMYVTFDDGTIYTPTTNEIEALKFSAPANVSFSKLYLVISRVSSSTNEVGFDDNKNSNTRYIAFENRLLDTTNEDLEQRVVTVAKLNVRVMLEGNTNANTVKIPICIISSNHNAEIEIDSNYIPPTLAAQKNHILNGYINELYGLLAQKSKNLANAVNDPNRGGSLEVTDFLMLQTVNRYLAYVLHQKEGALSTHPQSLFVELSKLCAELMTFLPNRKMGDMPIYNHKNLSDTFRRLMSNLRISLSTILEQRIVRIDLNKKDSATYVAQTPDQQILNTAEFILAVKADMPNEVLRSRLPSTIKISTVENISELVAYHLPGVKLNALSVAPRELPYHNGYVYFELEKQIEMWELFDDSSGMAFHIAGDFPNIDLEFWAIKPNINT